MRQLTVETVEAVEIVETVEINRKVRTLKAKCRIGWDWIGYDYTAVTP